MSKDMIVSFIEWDGKENEILCEVLEDCFEYNKGETFMFDPFVNSESFCFSKINKYELHDVDSLSSVILCRTIVSLD
ncbi:MAG: hypothetical protein GQ570_11915 [Helicobacteraceae bacterium]|nr:hypothetical protein [Helicobacteraceae bacterium]